MDNRPISRFKFLRNNKFFPKRVQTLRENWRYYYESLKWTIALLILLLLPLFFATSYDMLIDFCEYEREAIIETAWRNLSPYYYNGSFIIIILGLSGSVLIDYYFEYPLLKGVSFIYFTFFIIGVVSVIIYTLLYLFNLGEELVIDGMKVHADLHSIKVLSHLLFVTAFFFTFIVRAIILSHRDHESLKQG